jgi:NAD(P)-dependent dehydrogenase (short-subunit alcohol dehydrogenase family)
MRFTDKVAIITAFANGIGRATAEIMAREGTVVVGVDNHPDRLEEAIAALRAAGGSSAKLSTRDGSRQRLCR